MYQVLYRKWRPKTFADVVGQEHITKTLQNEITGGRQAHAYLFTGSRGTGKTTCAKIMAKAVNCLDSHDGNPCGQCEICKGIDSGAILDVVEIDAASNNGVDNIRELRDEAAFTPTAAKFRVYIIDEVHMLSQGAFNALLKTLEEPPAHVLFILATTEVHKLPATILSRCQRFDFKRIDAQVIAARLQFIAGEENAELSPDAALLIARLADGGMRDALSILDQCISRTSQVTVDTVNQAAGLAGREYLQNLCRAIREKDLSSAVAMLGELHQNSVDMQRLCEELIGYFRNLMILKTVKSPENLIVASPRELQGLEEQAQGLSLAFILYALETLQTALNRVNSGLDRKTEMELTIIKICSPQLETTPEALSARLDALEQAMRAAPAPAREGKKAAEPGKQREAPAPKAAPMPQEEPQAPASEEPEEIAPMPQETQAEDGAPRLLSDWPEIIKSLMPVNMALVGALSGSQAYESGSRILIDNDDDYFITLMKEPRHKDDLKKAILQVTGRKFSIGPYKRPEKPPQEDLLLKLAQDAAKAGIQVIKSDE